MQLSSSFGLPLETTYMLRMSRHCSELSEASSEEVSRGRCRKIQWGCIASILLEVRRREARQGRTCILKFRMDDRRRRISSSCSSFVGDTKKVASLSLLISDFETGEISHAVFIPSLFRVCVASVPGEEPTFHERPDL